MTNNDIRMATRQLASIGAYNMFDRTNVVKLAESLGFHEYAQWVTQNPIAYCELILSGRLPGDDDV